MKLDFSTCLCILLKLHFIVAEVEMPSQLRQPGLVVVLSTKCKFSKALVDYLVSHKIPHHPIYVEKDPAVAIYILQKHEGKVPWVYENGNLKGDGFTFMNQNNGSTGGIQQSGLVDDNRIEQCSFILENESVKVLK